MPPHINISKIEQSIMGKVMNCPKSKKFLRFMGYISLDACMVFGVGIYVYQAIVIIGTISYCAGWLLYFGQPIQEMSGEETVIIYIVIGGVFLITIVALYYILKEPIDKVYYYLKNSWEKA